MNTQSRISASLVAAVGCWFTFACHGEGEFVVPERLTPRSLGLSPGSADDSVVWGLFDRDTAQGWEPGLDGRIADIALSFDEGTRLQALRVFGASSYELSLLDAHEKTLAGPFDLSKLPQGWTAFEFPRVQRTSVTLHLEPRKGEATKSIAEIELWGTATPLPLAWEPSDTAGETPSLGLADVLALEPERQVLGHGAAQACVSFDFELTRHPGIYRRAWLRYQTEGVFRPFVLTRAFNDAAMVRGHWVKPEGNHAFVHPIDPESLRLGNNQVHFCVPGEADSSVTISSVEFLGELDHGSNLIEAASLAPYDGIPTESAQALLREESDPVTISASQELVLSLDRYIAPEAIYLGTPEEITWTARCVDADATAHELELAPVDDAGGLPVYRIEGGGQERCAGLRLRPSRDTSISAMRVLGSGAGRRIDFPRIVLASSREHFGLQAWVDGWAQAPSDVGGGVQVSIDEADMGTESGVFGSMLTRPADAEQPWPVAITARFADGTTFTKEFVLERNAGTMPGAIGSDLADGLTEEERTRRFGQVGQTAQERVRPHEAARVSLGTHVYVDIPAGALQGQKDIVLRHRDISDLPPLDPGMINVTAPFRHGYEFLPHRERFQEPLQITLPYQPSLLPPGYKPEDVETYYYDEDLKRWEPLARAEVERAQQTVKSLTDHFTTMINAVVVAPEHPQAASFDPTRLSGIKAASPDAAVRTVAPPQANPNGDVTMNIPLDLPPGRLGVQPSFAIAYNSARGNGWLGMGWDLSGVSTIGIDTRWGVPRYGISGPETNLETETYVIDGQQLSPTAHRSVPRPRTQGTVLIGTKRAKVFRPRVEGSFQRIVRYDVDPKKHWWEVTDKRGIRYFYGGTPESDMDRFACLADDDGNIYQWALREMRDTHGNRVRFTYRQVTSGTSPKVPGRELYLESVHYTLRMGEADATAPYRVVFQRESGRPDEIVSGRGGFKQVTADRLHRVEVYYRSTLVRAWQLAYDQGPFSKSRLRSITQFGVGNKPFPGNVHRFDYFDEVTAPNGNYAGFSTTPTWPTGDDEPDADLFIPDALASVGAASTTSLGGARTRSKGVHLYAGFNPFSPSKQNSFGVKGGSSWSNTNGIVALVDIDGDNLPDRVFRNGDRYWYNRNESGPQGTFQFEATAQEIPGLGALSHESSFMFSFGGEAYPLVGQVHLNTATSSMTQDSYLSDVNADGLVDLVQGSSVSFNRLDNEETGAPSFLADRGQGTPVPLGASAVATSALPTTFEDPNLDLDKVAPPVDTVRRWQAPYPGRVRITGSVALAGLQGQEGDGVRVAIEREGQTLWTHDFGPQESAPQNPSLVINDVHAGDAFYFRVHVLRDGHDDRVRWRPVIQYLDKVPANQNPDENPDENGLDAYRFDSGADFVMAGRTGAGLQVPFEGTLQLSGILNKRRVTTDNILVRVTVRSPLSTTTVFQQLLLRDAMMTLSLDQTIQVPADSFIALSLHSDSPIDLTALQFESMDSGNGDSQQGPWLRYLDGRYPDGRAVPVFDHRGRPLFNMPLPYDMTSYSLREPHSPAVPLVSSCDSNAHVVATVDIDGDETGIIAFTAKSAGQRLAKRTLSILQPGSYTLELDVDVEKNQPTFFSFSVSNRRLFEVTRASATYTTSCANGDLPTTQYGVADSKRLSRPYRGWSYGGYNGGQGRGNVPIVASVFEADVAFDNSDIPNDPSSALDLANQYGQTENRSFAFVPMPDALPCPLPDEDPGTCRPLQGEHWRGPDELVFVTATEMSASRLGGPGASFPNPVQIAGGEAVPRISGSNQTAVGAGIGPASTSLASGNGKGKLDFLDMNGDGYPDVVSPGSVQYTAARGVLDDTRDVAVGDLRRTNSQNLTLGIGGNIAEAEVDGRAQSGTAPGKGAGGNGGTEQMASVGFALNVGASGGRSDSMDDLMDVNGDGLPDRVRKDGSELRVSLNLGYKFIPTFERWGTATLHAGRSAELNGGASLSYGDGIYGFGGGITAGLSQSVVHDLSLLPDLPGPLEDIVFGNEGATLLDVNGDGLLDAVKPTDNGSLQVWFNLGHNFASQPVFWTGGLQEEINESRSTSLSGGLYFTIPIGPLCLAACYLILNPGGDLSESVERPTASIRDIDGDGYPDQLFSEDPHHVNVARNLTGRTGLLRHVERPLGAEIWLDYERKGNTQEMPQSRWVLSEVKLYDGQRDSSELGQANDYVLQKIQYTNGRYDRFEREFYGFEQVTVDTMDTRGWDGASDPATLAVYRRVEQTFDNTTYPEKNLLVESRLLAGNGDIFQRDTYEYQLRSAVTGEPLAPGQIASTESIFPAMVREDHYQHEGDPAAFLHTYTAQNYDGYGNVVSLEDGDSSGVSYRAAIRYTAEKSACASRHIVGTADRIVVRDAANTLLRERESDVECSQGNLQQIRVSLGSGAVAQTNLAYNADGNLIAVTAPPNRNGQRYRLDYTYDSQIQTHVSRIVDSFGYFSTASYDLKFGASTSETDLNGNSVLTAYDDFGRIASITGPYETEHGLSYALQFAYATTAPVPYATTKHMDMYRSVSDPIETVTFIDGVGKVLQTKKDAAVHRGDDAAPQDVMLVSGRVQYDPWGRVVAAYFPREENKSSTVNLAFTRQPDTSAPPTTTSYDLLDRVLETRLPDNARTQNIYTLETALAGAGRWAKTRTIDPEDNRRDGYRDEQGLTRAVVEYLDGRPITTRYEYDALDQIRLVRDAAGNQTQVGYDLAGRRTTIINPDTGHLEDVYDRAGNVIRHITPNLRASGRAIEYGYDFTHLVGIDYPLFSDNDVTYTWGAAALRGQEGNRVGRITRVKDASGTEDRYYGKLGETIREVRSINSHTMGQSDNSPEVYTTRYLYDSFGRLQQMVYPDTEVLTYAYDSGGQVRAAQGVKLGTQFPYVQRLEYDRFEQRQFLQTGNGIRTHYAYDAKRRWLDRLEAGDFQRLRYTFDKVGNITTLGNDLIGVRPNEYGGRVDQSFNYDDLYRLTSANGTWVDPPGFRNQYSYAVTYNDIHNILRKDQDHWVRKGQGGGGPAITQHKTTYDWTYTYGSSKPHAPTHIGDRTFFYDANGNQTGWDHDRNGTRRTIMWDEADRIRSISDNGHTTRFVYDDSGERVIKTGAQGETVYVNDKWTVRNREVGTKHIFVGTTRIASKLSPGDAHVRPSPDLISQMLGRWYEHRSESGHDHGRNVEMNPHYQVPGSMPEHGQPDSNFLYFYHPDHLGNTSYTTDGDGELYEHVQYFPSGELWVDQRSNTERLPYLFGSKELDQETGLSYFGARYYDPRVSVWASADPALPGYLDGAGVGGIYNSVNLASYTYGGHNALKYKDPDGRIFESVWDAVNVGMGVVSLVKNIATGNYGEAALDAAGVVADIAATALPGVPGGAATAIRGVRAGRAVVKTAQRLEKTIDTVRALDKIDDINDARKVAEQVNDARKVAGGKVYKVKGDKTPSGKPYIGRTKQSSPAKRGKRDGRDRSDAEIVDTYDANDKAAGRRAEQQAINREGGVDNLDNKRNEIRPDDWQTNGVDPPQ